MRHRYPVAPWEGHRHETSCCPSMRWPVALRRVEKPGYNRVFVSGRDVGIVWAGERAGTAGDAGPDGGRCASPGRRRCQRRGIAVWLKDRSTVWSTCACRYCSRAKNHRARCVLGEYRDGSVTRLGIVQATRVEAGMPGVANVGSAG